MILITSPQSVHLKGSLKLRPVALVVGAKGFTSALQQQLSIFSAVEAISVPTSEGPRTPTRRPISCAYSKTAVTRKVELTPPPHKSKSELKGGNRFFSASPTY